MRGVAASGVHGWISNGRGYVYFDRFRLDRMRCTDIPPKASGCQRLFLALSMNGYGLSEWLPGPGPFTTGDQGSEPGHADQSTVGINLHVPLPTALTSET
jgi:hypothetical protein